MSFPLDIAKARGVLDSYEALSSHVDKMRARPSYQHAIEKGGDTTLGFFNR